LLTFNPFEPSPKWIISTSITSQVIVFPSITRLELLKEADKSTTPEKAAQVAATFCKYKSVTNKLSSSASISNLNTEVSPVEGAIIVEADCELFLVTIALPPVENVNVLVAALPLIEEISFPLSIFLACTQYVQGVPAGTDTVNLELLVIELELAKSAKILKLTL
jgi:hypothetical protein